MKTIKVRLLPCCYPDSRMRIATTDHLRLSERFRMVSIESKTGEPSPPARLLEIEDRVGHVTTAQVDWVRSSEELAV